MTRELAGVTLASNILHSVYAADALAAANALDLYIGPVVFTPARWLRLVPEHHVASRVFPQTARLPLRRMWGPELLSRVSGRMTNDANRRALRHSGLVDAFVLRRLGKPEVFHFHTCGMVRSVVEARRRGAVLVADHRDVHPREHDYVDPLLPLLERELDLADWVIANSSFAAETLARWGVPERKLVVIPLGVNLEMFSPLPPATERVRHPVVLFVGSLIPRKGVDLLLTALAAPQFADVELRLCGPGSDTVTAGAKGGAGVTRLGPLSSLELLSEYRQATLLALPSRTDAYGLVATEALACGTPVLVTDRCGVSDLVRERGGGLVIPPGDVLALREALTRMLRDVKLQSRLSFEATQAAAAASWSEYGRTLQRWYVDSLAPLMKGPSSVG